MPILFPIAAGVLWSQKFCDRILVAYSYKIPPSMGPELRNQTINLLHKAPLFLLFNGFWALDGKSLFDNVWAYKTYQNENMKSLHYVGLPYNQSTPLLFISLASCVILFMMKILGRKNM